MSQVFRWQDSPKADFAVIGDPVAHSLSPKMHMAAYQAVELDYRYVAIHVPRGEVGIALDHLRELGYKGVNVTVPHKEDAMLWCEEVEPYAQRVRAVNTVNLSTRSGINTDGPGFISTINPLEACLEDVLMFGAGGSSRALAVALRQVGFSVRIWNRTPEKAKELAEIAECQFAETPDPTGAWLLLNTTSASLTGDQLPIDFRKASPRALAYDLAYGHGLTPFCAAAQEAGLNIKDGRQLLMEQGALSFEWWTGQIAPRMTMLEAIS